MLLSGALIPVSQSTGFLNVLVKILPMTYCLDLARAVFYSGNSVYNQIGLHNPWFDVAIIAGFFLLFSIVGTIMFTRAEKNR